jgi:hypothetical protein
LKEREENKVKMRKVEESLMKGRRKSIFFFALLFSLPFLHFNVFSMNLITDERTK